MGVYLYRVMPRTRKMTTGETVNEMKFVWKYSPYSDPPLRGEKTIPTTLVAYELTPGAEVIELGAGSNYWYDSEEFRRKRYGFIIPDGNRLKIFKTDDPHEVEALEILHGGGGWQRMYGNGVTLSLEKDGGRFALHLACQQEAKHLRVSFNPGVKSSEEWKIRELAKKLKYFNDRAVELSNAA